MPKPQDILGQKFGRLSVISATEEKDATGRTLYKCQCDCGGTRLAPAYLLLSGRVTSCGCAQEQVRKFAGRKERNAFTPEEEARRISTIISKEESGVYRRGLLRRLQAAPKPGIPPVLHLPEQEAGISCSGHLRNPFFLQKKTAMQQKWNWSFPTFFFII